MQIASDLIPNGIVVTELQPTVVKDAKYIHEYNLMEITLLNVSCET